MPWMRRISGMATSGIQAVVLAAAVTAGPISVVAQEPAERHARVGTLVGAGAGIAVGFGLAGATQYALKEGGAVVVTFLGAALGAVTGHKLSDSMGQPWRVPPRVQVTFPWAIGWSGAPDDIESALAACGCFGKDSHHALVPAVAVTIDALGPVRIGAEISGIRGVQVHGTRELATLSENVDGRTLSMLVLFGTRPSPGRRLTYSGGGGLDRYAVTVESYFDQRGMGSLPPDAAQPRRSTRSRAVGWGPQVRAGLEFYLTHDFSLKMDAVRRWRDRIAVPAIELIDTSGDVVARNEAHTVSLGSFLLSFGVGMRW